jgi:hypothetical protein
MLLENIYYDAIYDVISSDESHQRKVVALNKLKAKITRLNHHNNKRIFIDNHELDVVDGEKPSIFHIIRAMKRKDSRAITSKQDHNGITYTTPEDTMKTITDFIQEKYKTIETDRDSFEHLVTNVQNEIPEYMNDMLDAPITTAEIHRAVIKGKSNKAPGPDGMSKDFFKEAWDVIHPDLLKIMQQMHTDGEITTTQKHGMMVLIPKKNNNQYDQKTTGY